MIGINFSEIYKEQKNEKQFQQKKVFNIFNASS